MINVEVEPSEVVTRSFSSITISFQVDFVLPKNSILTFRFRGGRNNKNDWYYLQPYDTESLGYCELKTFPNHKYIPYLLTGKELKIKYLFYEKKVEAKTKFKLHLRNTLIQSLVEKKKKIDVIIELLDKNPIMSDNSPTIEIVNSKFDHFTIISPSIIELDTEFSVLIRAEDKFKNLITKSFFEAKLFLLSETFKEISMGMVTFQERNKGILRIEGLKIEEEGIFTFEIRNKENQNFHSNPIICRKSISKKLYWGFIHGHTNKSDGIRSIRQYFNNLINAGLDFGASTEHDHIWETSEEDFEEIKQVIDEFHHKNHFISFFGYEWGYWYTGYGDICIYFYDKSLPILRSDTNKYNSTEKLIKNLKNYNGDVLMIGHHSALRPGYRNWEFVDDSIERLVEIYSSWGNQENSHKDGNPLPPRYKFFGYGKHASKRGPILERKGSFVQDLLLKGHKIGFTAGGDDHYGIYPSGMVDPDNGIYPPGIMAVWTQNLTKEGLWDAFYNRKCYGTTGPRIIIEFYINGYTIGDCIKLESNNEFRNNRKLEISLISPLKINKLEIVRNNETVHSQIVNGQKYEYQWIDDVEFNQISLKHSKKQEQFIFYYLRVFMEEENMAWTSPIWFTRED